MLLRGEYMQMEMGMGMCIFGCTRAGWEVMLMNGEGEELENQRIYLFI